MDIKYGLNHELDPVKQPWAGRDHYFKFDQELQLACCLSSHHAEKKSNVTRLLHKDQWIACHFSFLRNRCIPFSNFKQWLQTSRNLYTHGHKYGNISDLPNHMQTVYRSHGSETSIWTEAAQTKKRREIKKETSSCRVNLAMQNTKKKCEVEWSTCCV